ncbi:MAG: hypothetical protein HKN13_06325 [Rhodothermales bacterium]|nr:hypothetical protein [Rhodothermales bacterium]
MTKTVSVLGSLARAGYPIVGLEPSCVSALSDDLNSVLPDSSDAKVVADKMISVERFIADDHFGLFANAEWETEDRSILLHGHCHQKALEGTAPVKKMLELTGARVEEVDSGCCGMAGAFGYEHEHVSVSRQMGERKLIPAVRAADMATTVAASGTSCRAQIEDLSGRQALHPVQILSAALHPSNTDC